RRRNASCASTRFALAFGKRSRIGALQRGILRATRFLALGREIVRARPPRYLRHAACHQREDREGGHDVAGGHGERRSRGGPARLRYRTRGFPLFFWLLGCAAMSSARDIPV